MSGVVGGGGGGEEVMYTRYICSVRLTVGFPRVT